MINLLPEEKKAEIRAARTNTLLIRYSAIILFALMFILSAMYVSYTVLGFTKTKSEEIIASNDIKAEVYSSTKAQVDTLSASLAETKQLLDGEILYSKVFVNIGQKMPPGTVLEKLSLDTSSFTGTPISTKAYAKTTNDILALRQSFESSPIFTGVTFKTVVESDTTVKGYPVSVDMTFSLTKAATQ